MGWGNKAIEIRSAETGHLDGVFMHKKAQKLKFLCERNDKVRSPIRLARHFLMLWELGGDTDVKIFRFSLIGATIAD